MSRLICTFVVYSSVQHQMYLLNAIKNAFAFVLNPSVLMYLEFHVLLIYTSSIVGKPSFSDQFKKRL